MGLSQDLGREPVSRLGPAPAETVASTATVREAVTGMKQRGTGAVLVLDDQRRPRGLFDERRLVSLLHQRGGAVMDDPIERHLVAPITIAANASIAQLVTLMEQHTVRWVCVVDEAGAAVGLIGLGEVIAYINEYFPYLVKVQPVMRRLSTRAREGA